MHCNLMPPEPRQPLAVLITTPCLVWCHRTYPLPYYSVLLLIHYFTMWPWPLTPWPLTLHICSILPVTWWNFVPNLNAVRQSAAELLQLQSLTLWPWTCFKCSLAWLWDNFHQVWPSTTYPIIAFFDADTLYHAVALTFDLLTLNF